MANIRKFDAATIRSVADGSATIAELDSLGFDNIFAIKADPDVVQRRTCQAGVRSIEGTERRVSYLMSTSNPVGRTGDVILTQGWDFSEFIKRGMPFLYDHNLDKKNYGLPLGRMDNLRFYEDQDGRKSRKPKMGYYSALIGDGVYTPYGVNDFNDLVYRMVDEGYMDGFSVGFRAMSSRKPNESERSEFAGMPERGGLTPYSVVHERTMLIEGSVTPVGMDPDATRIKRLKERVVTLSERGQASRSEAQRLLEILGIGDVRTVVPVEFGEGVFEPEVHAAEIEQPDSGPRSEPTETQDGDAEQRSEQSSSAGDDSGIESRIREIEGELAELADCAANLQGIAEEISGLRAIIEDMQCRTEVTDRIRKLEVVLGVEDNTTGKSNGKSGLDAALGL